MCHIVFLRRSDNVEHSLVTMEIRNNYVVQAKGKLNRYTTPEEEAVIEKYNKYLNKCNAIDQSKSEMVVC